MNFFLKLVLLPIICLICLSPSRVLCRSEESAFKAMGAPAHPKVKIVWNRYYDYGEIEDLCSKLARAFPRFIKQQSIGTSVLGKDIVVLVVTDFEQGDPERKPAMYIDGNIHSNEIQGSEVALYTAWYLAENSQADWIRELLANKTFYIIPSINPDARDYYMREANSPHTPRSGMLPRDDDGDGLVDEDGLDDLDDDGNIVMMRRRDPNGRWIADPEDDRLMIRVKPDEKGDFELLGWEGVDNDGDGLVNEDCPGYYDPNRNWGWNWQPSYVQGGSDLYPFSIPENRAVADFILSHPNIAGAQSYHNSGGMILRGPGAEDDRSTFNSDDVEIYDFLASKGEEMLPGYNYCIVYKDLYRAYGGELDFLYGARGIFTFSNELWTSFNYFRTRETESEGWFGRQKDLYRFDRLLLFQEGIVKWKKVNHPQYGPIEIGGIKKAWSRTPPSFMLEDMCHRNMAFTLFHAYHLPQLVIDSVQVDVYKSGLKRIDVIVRNDRVIPSRSAHEVKDNISRPDIVFIDGKSIQVVAGFVVENPLLDLSREQKVQPDRIKIDSVPGMGTVHVRWIISAGHVATIGVDSNKGGHTSVEKKL